MGLFLEEQEVQKVNGFGEMENSLIENLLYAFIVVFIGVPCILFILYRISRVVSLAWYKSRREYESYYLDTDDEGLGNGIKKK